MVPKSAATPAGDVGAGEAAALLIGPEAEGRASKFVNTFVAKPIVSC
jgi:hypothetical protein